MLSDYLPRRINSGRWVTSYTLAALRELPAETEFILPICSLATPYADLAALGGHLLPPLFREALDESLKVRMVERIVQCFPVFDDCQANARRVKIVELEQAEGATIPQSQIVAFSVDTAVEEHGPHLPLATDTVQSYGVLQTLSAELPTVELGRPVEYGQLTWGLPFGFSVDLTAELLTEYVSRYARALFAVSGCLALYVVDVHGSIVHRQAIVEGLKQSGVKRWAFRWLHEPLAEFASARGDQHAGGVETALVEWVNPQLLDSQWWPHRMDQLQSGQMSFEQAVELTSDYDRLARHVNESNANGIIGRIENYHDVDAAMMMERMLEVARADVQRLLEGEESATTAGESLW